MVTNHALNQWILGGVHYVQGLKHAEAHLVIIPCLLCGLLSSPEKVSLAEEFIIAPCDVILALIPSDLFETFISVERLPL